MTNTDYKSICGILPKIFKYNIKCIARNEFLYKMAMKYF